jgi:molybdopterin-biosynthesis enzyme MoeA-like protein
MNVTIINIGDELLIGQVVNTNASTMARMLTETGM